VVSNVAQGAALKQFLKLVVYVMNTTRCRGFTRPPVVRPWGVRWRARVPYPCSLNVPSLQDAGPMGDQNPMAYVHKGGLRILSYLM
jgi:hypothetical protein